MIAYEYIILDILYLFMHSVKKNVGRSTVSLHIAVIFAKIAELPLRIAHKADVLCAVEGISYRTKGSGFTRSGGLPRPPNQRKVTLINV